MPLSNPNKKNENTFSGEYETQDPKIEEISHRSRQENILKTEWRHIYEDAKTPHDSLPHSPLLFPQNVGKAFMQETNSRL